MNNDKTYCCTSESECALVRECARHWTNNITGTDRLMWTAQFKCRGPREARCPWYEEKDNGKGK